MKNFFNNKWFIIPTLFLVFGAVAVIATTIGDSGFSGIQVDNYFSGSGRQGINQNVSFEDADGNEHLLEFEDGLLVNYSLDEPLPDFPSDGLVSYWKLDELSGNVFDSQGTNNLNAYGSIVYGESGIMNNSIEINQTGTNPSTNRFEGDISGWNEDNMSFSIWFKRNSAGNGYGLATNNNDSYSGIRISIEGNYIISHVHSTGYSQGATYSWGAGDLNWHNLLTIYEDTNVQLWLDGVNVQNGTWDGRSLISGETFILGSDQAGSFTGNYNLDEFGIWNRTLTESEIQALYNNGNGLPYPN